MCGPTCKGWTQDSIEKGGCSGNSCTTKCYVDTDCTKITGTSCVGLISKWDPETKTSTVTQKGTCRPVKRTYSAYELAKVWIAASSGMNSYSFHNANTTESCAMAVTVALGECQHFANGDPTSSTDGGCDNIISNAQTGPSSGTRSGGIWRESCCCSKERERERERERENPHSLYRLFSTSPH